MTIRRVHAEPRSSRNPPAMKPCATCGHEFKVHACTLKRGGGKYCSVTCRPYRGTGNPKWRGGRIVEPSGRVIVYAPEHPDARLMRGTHIYEYRLVAEVKIGRRLQRNEIVHHIDNDPTNNAPENLQVMTQAEHARGHMMQRRRVEKEQAQ